MATLQSLIAAAGCLVCMDSWGRRVVGTRRIADWLLVNDPGADVTPNALMARSACFHCLSPSLLRAVRLRITADLVLTSNPDADVTPQGIASASSCWLCAEPGFIAAAVVASIPTETPQTPQESLARAACYYCLDPWTLSVIEVRMLADLLLLYAPDSDVTPAGLMARAACYECMPEMEIIAGDAALTWEIPMYAPAGEGLIYFGNSSNPGPLTEAQITALNSFTGSTPDGTYAFDASPASYKFFAWPSALGSPGSPVAGQGFRLGGLPVGMANASQGFTAGPVNTYAFKVFTIGGVSYRQYRTFFPTSGAVTIVIS